MSRVAPALVVLAGDRGPDDPLARSAGVAGKVLVEVAGRPMLAHVLETISQLDAARRMLVCPRRAEYLELAAAGGIDEVIEPATGPAASVMAALARLDADAPVLVVTGDHPLLRPEWLTGFIDKAAATGADAVVGVADYRAIAQAFPGSRRTRYRFADVEACGTNLFWFNGTGGRAVAGLWQSFEADRKRPWRIVARLGPVNLMRYLLGRLTLADAMAALSARLGCRLGAVVIDTPEAAVDVDSPADLALVREIFRGRERQDR
ncbi:MAG: NTP transferase domain-containing protein [Wenzhouxiangellaceae bacterium]|nr:NTP transferase domain-containing protein [Wenzhouxiangellaceae bacterium]